MKNSSLNKLSTKEKENIDFFNWLSRKYDNNVLSPWLRYIQRKAVERIEIKKKMRILDVGFGTGYTLKMLSHISGARLYGVDISSEMLRAARKKLGKKKTVLELAKADKMPFKSNYFDYVICTEAFHHFPSPLNVLREMKRVLNEEGKIILADIYPKPLFLFKGLFRLEPGHVGMYSKKEFREMFDKVGLNLIEQDFVGVFALLNIAEKRAKRGLDKTK